MTRAFVEFKPLAEDAPDFTSDTSDLVYFLSWAFSARYGANHELSIAALVLRGEFGVDLEPLLTYADREIESPVDAVTLEMAWQPPEPLAESAEKVANDLGSDDKRLASVVVEYPNLRRNIEELAEFARWAEERGAEIRLTYELTKEV